MSTHSIFQGTGVAVVTPFANGQIDYTALGAIIEHLINGKVEMLVCLGSTGEASNLTSAEKLEVLNFFVEKNQGRIPIIFGPFGDNNTDRLVQNIKSYPLDGVAAIMASAPAYVKPTQDGLYHHYMRLADNSPVPVLIYNVPSRTACDIKSDTILKLAHDHSNFLGVKEASADMMAMSRILKYRPPGFRVFSGDDITALSAMALGADGLISVLGNAFPYEMSQMIRCALEGNFKEAAAKHLRLLDLHPLIYCEGNPTGVKTAMSILGLGGNELRLPLTSLSAGSTEKLKNEIIRAGLLSTVSAG